MKDPSTIILEAHTIQKNMTLPVTAQASKRVKNNFIHFTTLACDEAVDRPEMKMSFFCPV